MLLSASDIPSFKGVGMAYNIDAVVLESLTKCMRVVCSLRMHDKYGDASYGNRF